MWENVGGLAGEKRGRERKENRRKISIRMPQQSMGKISLRLI